MSRVPVLNDDASSRHLPSKDDGAPGSAQWSNLLGLTRRQLLTGGSALVGLAALRKGVGVSGRAVAATPGRFVVGRVVQVVSRIALRFRPTAGTGIVLAHLLPSIRKTGLGDTSRLEVGEEIVAEGEWTKGGFYIDNLLPMCRSVEARVVRRQGMLLDTSAGKILLTSATRPQDSYAGRGVSLTSVGAGSAVAVLGRMDPKTHYLVASRISDMSRRP